MMSSPNKRSIFVPTLLLFIALLPRTLHLGKILTIDEIVWLRRSYRFVLGLKNLDWGATFQSGHPGVPTMWLAGWAMHLYQVLVSLFTETTVTFSQEGMRAFLLPARLPFALIASLSVPLIYLLLNNILNPKAALLGSLLIALDPFFIAHSRVVHTDSFLSVFMTLSLFALLVFIEKSELKFLICSGVSAGLAFLTKASSFFLLPFTLLMLLWSEVPVSSGFKGLKHRIFNRTFVETKAKIFMIWLLSAVVTVFVLWPALWVKPLEAISYWAERTELAITTSHYAPRYTLQPFYYIKAIVFYTTPVSLLLFALCLVHLSWKASKNRFSLMKSFRYIFPLLAFILLFVAIMTFGAKKGERYILPVFILIDVLAGVGLCELGKLPKVFDSLFKGVTAGIILFQVIMLVSVHPYYLAAYNRLLPRPIEAKMGWGEGLEKASEYLNQKDDAENLVISSWYPEVFATFFEGETVSLDMRNKPWVDYVVLYKGMLGRGEESGATEVLRQFYKVREPEKTIFINGLEYVWIYRVRGEEIRYDISNSTNYELNGKVRLLGYDLPQTSVGAGESLQLSLYWQALSRIKNDYTVFVHLADSHSRPLAQQDNQPRGGRYPTSSWDPGEVLQDSYEIRVPLDIPSGEYQILVGMYLLETMERLPAFDASGTRLPNDAITLGNIQIEP